MKIIWQSAHALIADKPPGILTVPGRTVAGQRDSRVSLGKELELRLGARLWPVHRLDFEVSGLVLFAKTADAHRLLNQAFEEGGVRKTYEAWTEARNEISPHEEWVEWRGRILRGKKRAFESQHGKIAVTRARIVAHAGSSARWELEPVTGRSHQLRFHLSQHGFPILGDSLYGATRPYVSPLGGPAIALRAFRLEFQSQTLSEAIGAPLIFEVSGLGHAGVK